MAAPRPTLTTLPCEVTNIILENLGEEGLIRGRGNLGGVVGVERGLQEVQYHVRAKIPMRTVSRIEEREVDGERVRTKVLESVEEPSFDPPLRVGELVVWEDLDAAYACVDNNLDF
jgi:hypothetical protein